MASNLDNLERDVVAALHSFPKASRRWAAAKLNRETKRALSRVAAKLGCSCHATGFGGEKSYDFCCHRTGANDVVVDLPLAMECELSSDYGGILEDFQKLLVSRAAHRLLLCRQSPDDWALFLEELTSQIASYRGTANGDRCLFGCWTRGAWHFKSYVHEPPSPPSRQRVWLFQANPNSGWDPVIEVRRGKKDDWDAQWKALQELAWFRAA